MEHMQDEHFDRWMKDKLSTYEPEVPPFVWAGIDHQLRKKEEEKVKVVRYSFRKWMAMAAAAIVILCSVAFLKWEASSEVIYLKAESAPEAAPRRFESSSPSPEVLTALQGGRPDPEAAVKMVSKGSAEERHLASGRQDQSPAYRSPALLDASVHRETLFVKKSSPPLNLPHLKAIPLPQVRLEPDEEPVLMADVSTRKNGFQISGLLNSVVAAVDKGEQKFIEFKNDDEGSLSFAVNVKSVKSRIN